MVVSWVACVCPISDGCFIVEDILTILLCLSVTECG